VLQRIAFVHCLPTPPQNPLSYTRAYVTHMKDNVSRSIEIRQVIHDTRISNVIGPGVTSRTCTMTKVIRNKRAVRHTHVKKITCFPIIKNNKSFHGIRVSSVIVKSVICSQVHDVERITQWGQKLLITKPSSIEHSQLFFHSFLHRAKYRQLHKS
jgi:hypothetical protein